MRLTKQIAILNVVFLLAMACPMLFADVVPGAVLYLDANDNPADSDV